MSLLDGNINVIDVHYFFSTKESKSQKTSLACKMLRKYFITWILTSDPTKIALTINFTKSFLENKVHFMKIYIKKINPFSICEILDNSFPRQFLPLSILAHPFCNAEQNHSEKRWREWMCGIPLNFRPHFFFKALSNVLLLLLSYYFRVLAFGT